MIAKINHAVDILVKLERMLPSEPTAGHVLATLKHFTGDLKDPKAFKANLDEILRGF